MIAVIMAACIVSGKPKTDTLSTKTLAKEYGIFYNPLAVLISPPKYQFPHFILIPFFFNGRGGMNFQIQGPASSANDSTGTVKRLHEGLRQKK